MGLHLGSVFHICKVDVEFEWIWICFWLQVWTLIWFPLLLADHGELMRRRWIGTSRSSDFSAWLRLMQREMWQSVSCLALDSVVSTDDTRNDFSCFITMMEVRPYKQKHRQKWNQMNCCNLSRFLHRPSLNSSQCTSTTVTCARHICFIRTFWYLDPIPFKEI